MFLQLKMKLINIKTGKKNIVISAVSSSIAAGCGKRLSSTFGIYLKVLEVNRKNSLSMAF